MQQLEMFPLIVVTVHLVKDGIRQVHEVSDIIADKSGISDLYNHVNQEFPKTNPLILIKNV